MNLRKEQHKHSFLQNSFKHKCTLTKIRRHSNNIETASLLIIIISVIRFKLQFQMISRNISLNITTTEKYERYWNYYY